MQEKTQLARLACAAIFLIATGLLTAQEPTLPPTTIVLSVADQKLAVLRGGAVVARYPISTSRFGVGDSYGSYKTPIGQLRVCDRIGENLAEGAVLKHRSATGEVLPVNARGRDPIVTRILWLEGLEEQNRNARSRGIYIHGTPEEKRIGEPVSWGCIRMRSRDVVEVFEEVPHGTLVTILAEKLPRFPKYHEPKPVILASNVPAPAAKSPAVPVVKTKANSPAPTPAPVAAGPVVEKKTARTAAASGPRQTIVTESWAQTSRSAASEAMRGSILHAGLPGAATLSQSAPASGPRLAARGAHGEPAETDAKVRP